MLTYTVEDAGGGVIKVAAAGGVMRRPQAETLCREIEDIAARYPRRAMVLMDLGALSKATPAAGAYAFRRMKEIPFRAIALFRGNRFMRGMARTVMTLARFPAFGLFADEAAARSFLAAQAEKTVAR